MGKMVQFGLKIVQTEPYSLVCGFASNRTEPNHAHLYRQPPPPFWSIAAFLRRCLSLLQADSRLSLQTEVDDAHKVKKMEAIDVVALEDDEH